MRTKIILMIISLMIISTTLITGCAVREVDVTVPQDHPAHPDALEVAYMTPSDELSEKAALARTDDGQSAKSELQSLPDAAAKHLIQLLDAYVAIGDQLATDKTETIADHAKQIAVAVELLAKVKLPDAPHFWHKNDKLAGAIGEPAQALTKAGDIKAARKIYGRLGDAVERLIKLTGVPASYNKPVYGFVCGMVKDAPRKGVWLQVGDKARNPFFGATMLRCHSKQYALPVTGKTASSHDEHGQHKEHDSAKDGGKS